MKMNERVEKSQCYIKKIFLTFVNTVFLLCFCVDESFGCSNYIMAEQKDQGVSSPTNDILIFRRVMKNRNTRNLKYIYMLS